MGYFGVILDPHLGSAMGISHCHCHRVNVGLPGGLWGGQKAVIGHLRRTTGQLWGAMGQPMGCYRVIMGHYRVPIGLL